MAATALLKFTQGSRVGDEGHALIIDTGTAVTIENSDNTDVASWRIELLYGPPGSSFEQEPGTPLLLAQNANSSTPLSNLTPEGGFPGCYRIQLTVWGSINFNGPEDTDIRNVTVLTEDKRLVLPPYQNLPAPKPLEGPGNKPNELNFEGQPWGWSGPNYGHPTYGSEFERFRALNSALSYLESTSKALPGLAQTTATSLTGPEIVGVIEIDPKDFIAIQLKTALWVGTSGLEVEFKLVDYTTLLDVPGSTLLSTDTAPTLYEVELPVPGAIADESRLYAVQLRISTGSPIDGDRVFSGFVRLEGVLP